MNGVIQPRFTKEEIKKPTEISIHSEKEKEKIIEQDIKNTVFLNQIKKKETCDVDTPLSLTSSYQLSLNVKESTALRMLIMLLVEEQPCPIARMRGRQVETK